MKFAATYTLKRGRRFKKAIELTDNEDNPLDLSNAAIDADLLDKPGGTVLGTFTIEEIDLANGQFYVILDVATTDAISSDIQEAVFDIKITDYGEEPWNTDEFFLVRIIDAGS